jgi:hypothetical protein
VRRTFGRDNRPVSQGSGAGGGEEVDKPDADAEAGAGLRVEMSNDEQKKIPGHGEDLPMLARSSGCTAAATNPLLAPLCTLLPTKQLLRHGDTLRLFVSLALLGDEDFLPYFRKLIGLEKVPYQIQDLSGDTSRVVERPANCVYVSLCMSLFIVICVIRRL